ncbi:accessory protein [Planococcus donghaensis MPA1U2]|uniref:Accessory protein n=1 Tax=Planococcus donghaensis MPA1U2 TaxID=933115 RepID=E7RDE5_9BACL|nr:pirin family protein [Planococcus donghaensis]EGA90949.1 accessory protein [Planococcus donghaensis MPA1U2]
MNILRNEQAYSNGGGAFSLQFRRPGLIDGNFEKEDHAFGPLSRIDHAKIGQGTKISMHEHINDEILSYMWRGEMLHEDSSGLKKFCSPTNQMLMGAGNSFFHEESTPTGSVEMLQIFIRPAEKDLEPRVLFADMQLPEISNWRLIAGPSEVNAPLELRQQIVVYDVHGKPGETFTLPVVTGYTPWLYVMDGEITAHGESLHKGDAISSTAEELTTIQLEKDTTIVLFLVDLKASMTLAGSFSGVKRF